MEGPGGGRHMAGCPPTATGVARSKEPVTGASETSLNFCSSEQRGDALHCPCVEGVDSGATRPRGPQWSRRCPAPGTGDMAPEFRPETQPGWKPECPHFPVIQSISCPYVGCRSLAAPIVATGAPGVPAVTGCGSCPSPSSEACDTGSLSLTGVLSKHLALTRPQLTLGFEQPFLSHTEGRSQMQGSHRFPLPGQLL